MIFLGDAESTLRPHSASGTAKALTSAINLFKQLKNAPRSTLTEQVSIWKIAQQESLSKDAQLAQSMGDALVTHTPDWSELDQKSAQQWWDEAVMQGKTWYATTTNASNQPSRGLALSDSACSSSESEQGGSSVEETAVAMAHKRPVNMHTRFFQNHGNGFISRTARSQFIREMPKAEVHVHIEGTMNKALIQQLALQAGRAFPEELFDEDGRISWHDFRTFITAYDMASGFVSTKDAFHRIIYDYLRRSAEEGVIYTELTISPQHLARFDISYDDCIDTAVEAIKQVRSDGYDIEARIIIVLVRHQGIIDKEYAKSHEDSQNAANLLVDKILSHRAHNTVAQKYIVAVGLAGAEEPFPVGLYEAAFAKVRANGLALTLHAGEYCSHEEVLHAIELGATRIGHGIFSAFDIATMEVLKSKKISLEICLSSNLNLVNKSIFPEEFQNLVHPIVILEAQGVQYSINTDDPPFFLTREKKLVDMCGEFGELCDIVPTIDAARLLSITQHTIETSFAEPELKEKLLAKLIEFEKNIFEKPESPSPQ